MPLAACSIEARIPSELSEAVRWEKGGNGRFGTRRPLVWASDLLAAAFEWVQAIETAIKISRIVRICIGPKVFLGAFAD